MTTEPESNKAFLFHCAELKSTNAETIAKIFTEAVHKLWPNDTPSKMDQVFLFLTDAAPYMVKAAKNLKVLYSRMTHVTCAAHGIHRVCETIRAQFPLTNTIISTGKKVFLKAPYRVQLFKSMYPEIPLPPEPITTRWGTWIKAAEYYSDYLFELVEVFRALDDDSEAIKTAKETIEKPELVTELTTIKSNYVCLADIITKLESSTLTLFESLALVNEAETKLATTPNEKIKKKFADVLKKNTGLHALSAISRGDTAARSKFDYLSKMSPTDLSCFKYARIVSCDVERSFSIFKTILTDRRRSFNVGVLFMHLIISCYT